MIVAQEESTMLRRRVILGLSIFVVVAQCTMGGCTSGDRTIQDADLDGDPSPYFQYRMATIIAHRIVDYLYEVRASGVTMTEPNYLLRNGEPVIRFESVSSACVRSDWRYYHYYWRDFQTMDRATGRRLFPAWLVRTDLERGLVAVDYHDSSIIIISGPLPSVHVDTFALPIGDDLEEWLKCVAHLRCANYQIDSVIAVDTSLASVTFRSSDSPDLYRWSIDLSRRPYRDTVVNAK